MPSLISQYGRVCDTVSWTVALVASSVARSQSFLSTCWGVCVAMVLLLSRSVYGEDINLLGIGTKRLSIKPWRSYLYQTNMYAKKHHLAETVTIDKSLDKRPATRPCALRHVTPGVCFHSGGCAYLPRAIQERAPMHEACLKHVSRS